MLSICIPIYNFDVTELVNALSNQLKNISDEANIVLIDDFSEEQFKNTNKKVCKNHTYIELEQNIGRSKIRNLFLNYTTSKYLLFLDCDSKITSDNFIANYLSSIKSNKEISVSCGGRTYPDRAPTKEQILSWKYGIKRESKSYTERQKKPYVSFMTNNFLVKKSVLETIPFDERLTQYGHEDTLFGSYLKKYSIPILHINNAVLNGDIEENEAYLNKTKLAIENLILILKNIDDKETFMKEVTLLYVYNKIKPWSVIKLLNFFSPILNKVFLFSLKLGRVNINLFNIYKLNYLSQMINKKG